MVIKSTIPVGYTENIIFSPEFLREGLAISTQVESERATIFWLSKKISTSFLQKLSNTYLAMSLTLMD